VPAAVALGGAIGTLARYQVTVANPVDPGAFPWPTFLVNVVGSALVGALMAWCLTSARAPASTHPFAVVGVCGGLTTFSTWMVADVMLLRDGDVAIALLDVGATLVAGLVAVTLGFLVTRRALGGALPVALDPEAAD
jgi:CrcB protein